MKKLRAVSCFLPPLYSIPRPGRPGNYSLNDFIISAIAGMTGVPDDRIINPLNDEDDHSF